ASTASSLQRSLSAYTSVPRPPGFSGGRNGGRLRSPWPGTAFLPRQSRLPRSGSSTISSPRSEADHDKKHDCPPKEKDPRTARTGRFPGGVLCRCGRRGRCGLPERKTVWGTEVRTEFF